MRMAQMCGISVAQHGLIRLKPGELAYVSRRFDRVENTKLAMEDACLLSELLTEKKYKGSKEKVGKIIAEHSSLTGLDAIRFYEIALFSYLTGNADMHLKNFSLLTQQDGKITLSPAYDLLATSLLVPNDAEEMALTVNGKKAKLKRADFLALATSLSLAPRARDNAFRRIGMKIPAMFDVIDSCFMSVKMKKNFKKVIESRAAILEMG